MDEIGNNGSEYMPQLIFALMKAGATPSAINNFRTYHATASRSAKLPCPHCFAGGKQGWLDIIRDRGTASSLKCHRCEQEIRLRRDD